MEFEIGRGTIESAAEFLTEIVDKYEEEVQRLVIPLQKIIKLKPKL